MRMIFISSLLLFTSISLNALPYRVIVVSQGEELTTRALSSAGQKRAATLVSFFLGIPPKIPPFFSDMVTQSPKKSPKHPITLIGAPASLGAIQTISPLANVIFPKKAPISEYTNMPESVQQYMAQKISILKNDLYENPVHEDMTAVICWEDKEIPKLLIALEPTLKNNRLFKKTFSSHQVSDQAFVISYKHKKPSFHVFKIQ